MPCIAFNHSFPTSYFSEILKSFGPLKATDSRLTEPLSFLPEEKSQLIALSGGLEKFLLGSPLFVAHGDLICLAEDAPIVKDSISQSSSATSSSSSLGSDLTNTQKDTSRVQVSSVVASDVQVGSQTVTKNSHGSGRHTPSHSTADRQPSLSSLIDSHQQETLSGGLKFDNDMKLNPTKTYGVELGSSLNSPSNSPLDSPRMMSPTDHVNLNTNKNSGTGSGKQQKLGAMAHGLTKRPDSAGERREKENIQPKDATSSSSSSSSSSSKGQQQQSTKMVLSSSSGRAIGHERYKKKERQTSRGSESRDSGREEGSEKLSSSSSERLLSAASDSGELGVLGEFFGHATASSGGGTGNGAGSRSGSGSGSQGDETTSTSASALANSKLFRAAISGASTTSAEKEASADEKGATKITTSSVSVETREAFAQTLRLKTGVKFVQTDPLPSVENFKDRYEKVLKEKKDLQVKLERSEDQKFKMQRDHKREIDKLEKKYYTEARKVGIDLCSHVIVT